MEITYSKSGDHYISDLALQEEELPPIGKYGRMRKHIWQKLRSCLHARSEESCD